MKYMRKELDDTYGFLELQDKILEMMVYLDNLCRENSIDYCLMGGSALGAKRHGGFIPWDDDLDIFMTPDNYEKFREIFISSGDKRFYLQEWGAVDGMVTVPKFRMNGTTYIEKAVKDWDIHQGIFVDIFILHNCPNNRLQQIYQCMWAKYVKIKGLAARQYDSGSGLKKILIKLANLFPDYFLVRYGLKQVYKYRSKTTNFYCNFMGKAMLKDAIYPREWFEKNKYVPFETVELKAPGCLHEFLSSRFGNYMKIPEANQIKKQQHALDWKVDEDFRTYLNKNDMCYSDEKKLI